MTVKTADSKARISLPKSFAGQTVLIDQVDENEVRIRMAAVIPQRELWLRNNPVAFEMVTKGLEEARAGLCVPAPDFAADAALFSDEDDAD